MTRDGYKGESYSKKIARAWFWSGVSVVLGIERLREGRHLVLASREGGDIGVLHAFGVPLRNIIAVDSCESAAASCSEKWPEADVRHGDGFALAAELAPQLQSVHLDICGPVQPALTETMAKCSLLMRHGSIVSFAALRGRERSIVVKRFSKMAKQSDLDALQRMPLEFRERALLRTRYGKDGSTWKEQRKDFDFSRIRAAQRLLYEKTVGARVGQSLVLAINYQSSTQRSNGVPMTMGAFKIYKRPEMPVKRFKAFMALTEEQNAKTACDNGLIAEVLREEDSECSLRDAVQRLPRSDYWSSQRVGWLYNIRPGTVAAWRAHETRRAAS